MLLSPETKPSAKRSEQIAFRIVAQFAGILVLALASIGQLISFFA